MYLSKRNEKSLCKDVIAALCVTAANQKPAGQGKVTRTVAHPYSKTLVSGTNERTADTCETWMHLRDTTPSERNQPSPPPKTYVYKTWSEASCVMVMGVRSVVTSGDWGLRRGGAGRLFGRWQCSELWCTFGKTDWTVHLGSGQFTVCKLNLN